MAPGVVAGRGEVPHAKGILRHRGRALVHVRVFNSENIYNYTYIYPLVMTNIAMENGPFIDGLPIKHGDFQ